MIMPRKMQHIDISVLNRDADAVIEHLGRRALIHFSENEEAAADLKAAFAEAASAAEAGEEPSAAPGAGRLPVEKNLEQIRAVADWLGIEFPGEPDESTRLPGPAEADMAAEINAAAAGLISREQELKEEKTKVEAALNEAQAFSGLHAPFAELDRLSYLTLRIGRLDARGQAGLRESLGSRAVIIPLGIGKTGEQGDRILAAASRKGRFALDSELKKHSFVPITIPEGFQGVPEEMLSGLESRLESIDGELEKAAGQKDALSRKFGRKIRELAASWLMAATVEEIKGRLVATSSSYLLSGWVPQDRVAKLAKELSDLTDGRIAIRAFNPDEIPRVQEGREKVPVSLKHGAFVRGFEGVVMSYGAPPYGTIDPSPLVAFFFTLMFGLMFGDVGQGFVLFLLGLLTGPRGLRKMRKFGKYSTPLISVGLSSMVMGFLVGSVFTNEELLTGPTRALTGLLTGHPVNHILTLLPMASHGGSMMKLLFYFGFTVVIGILLISIGLVINIINYSMRRKYEEAFFSRTGLAGLLFFWYAIFMALRIVLGGRFMWFDLIGLALPVLCIIFSPAIWRLASGERPVLEHGLAAFFIECFVGVLETVSTYFSNTVSFLRVGAFTLSHLVLSYIVFLFTDKVAALGFPLGSLGALLIMLIGNGIIIVLEGLIVAIQVVRLQYYEFFSKFFVETGVKFSPFRFRKEAGSY
ncbi:MAG: V-type ATP synthase subunit I [Treponema sp.]|jgi:V/A-type H+-transporting ATPase subunit I|nr:V-type ATP synthase subunit I [Treponema sp.]